MSAARSEPTPHSGRGAAPLGGAAATSQTGSSERALIGALLLNASSAWPRVSEVVEAKHFADARHRLIFTTIAELCGEGLRPDAAVTADRLSALGGLDRAGGVDYLVELVDSTSSSASVETYARIVREASDRAQLLEILGQASTKAREQSAEAAIEYVRQAAEIFEGRLVRSRPLRICSAASWAEKDPPPPREWVLDGLIPAARVTSLLGNGGLGKTLLAVQIGLHVSLGRQLFGVDASGGPVLGIFCEDEQDELERRTRAAVEGEQLSLEDADRFYPLSRDGENSLLCTFERDEIRLTGFYRELEATIAEIGPRLVTLDTAADLFAGEFMSTPHVRQFLKIALNGLCVRYGCAVLLLAHPSAAGMNSGDGGGFSTAWNNSVRSRLYLRRPKGGDTEEAQNKRVLEVRKANYGPDGTTIPLLYQSGCFVRDPYPIDESPGGSGKGKPIATKLALVIHDFMKANSPGIAIPFHAVLDHVMATGVLPLKATPAASRKAVQRALSHLCESEIIRKCELPRGSYRYLSEEGSDRG